MLKWADMQKLSRDELIEAYDREGRNVGSIGCSFIRDEIFQRDLAEQGDRMERMTREMKRLTKVIAWLTVAIAVLTAISTYWIIAET